MALPVTGQRHFPWSDSSGRFRTSQTPTRTTRTPMTGHGPRPERRLQRRRLIVDRELERLKRRPDRLERADAGGAGSDRESEQHHPCPERALAQPVPGAAGASAPEDHADAEDEAAAEVGEPPERPDRDRFDQAELEDVHADDRDQEGEDVGAQDRRVAHERPVGQCPGETEAPALCAVAEEQPCQERAGQREEPARVHRSDLSAPAAPSLVGPRRAGYTPRQWSGLRRPPSFASTG